MKYFKLLLIIFMGIFSVSCLMMLDNQDEPYTKYYISTMNVDGSDYEKHQSISNSIYSTFKFSFDDQKIIMFDENGFWTLTSEGDFFHHVKMLEYADCSYFTVSPISNELAYSYQDSLYILNYETGDYYNVFPGWNAKISDPSYSSDGNYILFSSLEYYSEYYNRLSIYRVDCDGTNKIRLYTILDFTNTEPFGYPNFTEDQINIVFVYNRLKKYNLITQNFTLIDEHHISTSPIQIEEEYLVYERSGKIYTYNFDTEVTNELGNGRYPALSPDGQKVAFESYTNNEEAVCITDIDGSNCNYYSEYYSPTPSFNVASDRIVLRGQKYIAPDNKKDPLGINIPPSILDK